MERRLRAIRIGKLETFHENATCWICNLCQEMPKENSWEAHFEAKHPFEYEIIRRDNSYWYNVLIA